MEATNSKQINNTKPEILDNVTISQVIHNIHGLIQATLKKVTRIDCQVQRLTKDKVKDTSVVVCT